MRTGFLFWIVVLAMGYTSQVPASAYIATEEIEEGVAECSGPNLNTLRCARGIERKLLAGNGNAIKRSDGVLEIHTARKTITLVDKHTDSWDDTVVYSYLGLSKKLNSHILYVQYYEGGAYMVIHHYSAQIASPSGYPIASPDGKHFLSISEDMYAGYSPNNIEIWQVASGSFRKLASFDPEWGPHRGSWLDYRRVRIDKHCYDSSKDNPSGLKPCGVARIERSDSIWKLIE